MSESKKKSLPGRQVIKYRATVSFVDIRNDPGLHALITKHPDATFGMQYRRGHKARNQGTTPFQPFCPTGPGQGSVYFGDMIDFEVTGILWEKSQHFIKKKLTLMLAVLTSTTTRPLVVGRTAIDIAKYMRTGGKVFQRTSLASFQLYGMRERCNVRVTLTVSELPAVLPARPMSPVAPLSETAVLLHDSILEGDDTSIGSDTDRFSCDNNPPVVKWTNEVSSIYAGNLNFHHLARSETPMTPRSPVLGGGSEVSGLTQLVRHHSSTPGGGISPQTTTAAETRSQSRTTPQKVIGRLDIWSNDASSISNSDAKELKELIAGHNSSNNGSPPSWSPPPGEHRSVDVSPLPPAESTLTHCL